MTRLCSTSAIRAANSAPIPHESESSWTITTRFVFFTDSAIASMSNGLMVRRSITSVEIPERSATSFAATSERCTSAPQVITVTSVPSRAVRAFPNGIMKFGPG